MFAQQLNFAPFYLCKILSTFRFCLFLFFVEKKTHTNLYNAYRCPHEWNQIAAGINVQSLFFRFYEYFVKKCVHVIRISKNGIEKEMLVAVNFGQRFSSFG